MTTLHKSGEKEWQNEGAEPARVMTPPPGPKLIAVDKKDDFNSRSVDSMSFNELLVEMMMRHAANTSQLRMA